MKIHIHCGWTNANKNPQKYFSFGGCWELVQDYTYRISERGFTTSLLAGELTRPPRTSLWLCHPEGKMLSSEQMAEQFSRVMATGTNLLIAIGGDQGFSKDSITQLVPDLLWSFGPLTLPHELAAVVASEQLYRAISILRNEPYHRGNKNRPG